jgi:hypothetical protein
VATKQPDLISLSFVAVTEGLPARITLKEQSLAFADADHLAGQNLVSGVYGAHSKQMALVMASEWKKANQGKKKGPNQANLIDVLYRVDKFMESRGLTTRDDLDSTGWLHLDRLSADLREEIRAEWLKWMRADLKPSQMNSLEDTSLGELALQYPRYVGKMMAKRNPRLSAVVHPVYPDLNPSIVLWVATVRYEKERFVDPVVRFMKDFMKVDV